MTTDTWPDVRLPRGARWHGAVTLDGVTTEEHFISDGEKLVLLYGDEGKALVASMEEPDGALSPTGG